MFTNLIESTSHHDEVVRKGRFFLATLAGYALVVMFAGVASIYAYDAQLANQNLELFVLVAPVDAPTELVARENPPRSSAPASGRENTLPERTEAISPINSPMNPPDSISIKAASAPPIPPGKYIIGDRNTEGTGIYNPNLPPGTGPASTEGTGRPAVDVADIGAPPARSDPPKVKPIVSKGVINGQAIAMPNPTYPELAKRAGAQGVVSVQILVDEFGKVVSARAYGGHVLLRQAAEQAAMRTRFSPTKLSEVPVKVSGTITFNFVLHR